MGACVSNISSNDNIKHIPPDILFHSPVIEEQLSDNISDEIDIEYELDAEICIESKLNRNHNIEHVFDDIIDDKHFRYMNSYDSSYTLFCGLCIMG